MFDLQFSPFKENFLVSCGVKQITFWTLIGNTLQKKKGIFGQTKNITTMFSLAFCTIDQELIYTGTMDGQIFIWKGTELKEIIPAAHESSIFQITKLGDKLFTAGKDGNIRIWNSDLSPVETINLKHYLHLSDSPDFSMTNGLNKTNQPYFFNQIQN